VKYNDSVKPPARYLALNPDAKFVPEWGMEHGGDCGFRISDCGFKKRRLRQRAGEKRRWDAEKGRNGDAAKEAKDRGRRACCQLSACPVEYEVYSTGVVRYEQDIEQGVRSQ